MGVIEQSGSESIEMVWACGKNGLVSHIQKGVDGGSKRRVGTRQTEIRLDGWCKGVLGQHMNDSESCSTMREGQERVESPAAYVTDCVSLGHFCLALYSFGPHFRVQIVITWRGVGWRYMMRFG